MIDSSPRPAQEPGLRTQSASAEDEGADRDRLTDVEARLAVVESRYASLFHGTYDAILVHDDEGRVLDANERSIHLFGFDIEQLYGLRLTDLTHSASRAAIRHAIHGVGSTAEAGGNGDAPPAAHGGGRPLELELVKRSGEVFAAEVSMQRLHRQTVASVQVPHNGSTVDEARLLRTHIRDLSERRRVERRLHNASFRDEVTGLPNRAHLLDRVQVAIDRSMHRADARFALLLIGVDRIDLLSDGLGHVAGATLLRQLADRLRATTPDDAPARVGDGLFAILLHDIAGVIDARQIAESVADELRRPFRIGSREIYLGATVGIVTSEGSYERAEDCLRDADIALADARRARSGTHRVFDPGMHDRLVDQLDLEHGLRRALEEDELTVYYQPVVSLASGRVDELEALVRWSHPRRGLIAPDLFLPMAAELGIDDAIDDHVMGRACRQLVAWREALGDDAPRRVAVNVSSRHFGELELVSRVRRALDESGLEPAGLRVEVTESALIEEAEAAVTVLEQLRTLGVKVSLDDFGTGYSSLGYLHRFPVDTLKIDRSFVSGPSEASPVLEAAVALGHQLGLEVVAEGVETTDDLERVRRLGCEQAQGWLFARPESVAAVTRLLRGAPRW